MPWMGRPPFLLYYYKVKPYYHGLCQCPERGDLHFYSTDHTVEITEANVSMPWKGRPPFLHLPLGTRINKGFADPFLQVFSRIFWKRLFWRWFLACSQFVHIYRRNEGNFSLSAAPIITDFFRLHKQIIFHYCDHYLRSHHPPNGELPVRSAWSGELASS